MTARGIRNLHIIGCALVGTILLLQTICGKYTYSDTANLHSFLSLGFSDKLYVNWFCWIALSYPIYYFISPADIILSVKKLTWECTFFTSAYLLIMLLVPLTESIFPFSTWHWLCSLVFILPVQLTMLYSLSEALWTM